jgi:hypothetical protein
MKDERGICGILINTKKTKPLHVLKEAWYLYLKVNIFWDLERTAER